MNFNHPPHGSHPNFNLSFITIYSHPIKVPKCYNPKSRLENLNLKSFIIILVFKNRSFNFLLSSKYIKYLVKHKLYGHLHQNLGHTIG